MLQNNDYLSDLIKIGIPSLVALVGTLSSVVLAWWNHKQNVLIETLRYGNEAGREKVARTGELVRTCAVEVGDLHHHVSAYTSVLFARIDTEAAGDPWAEAERELLSEAYQAALAAFHRHLSVQSYVVLLGDPELIRMHQSYVAVISRLMEASDESPLASLDECDLLMQQCRDLQLAVLQRMSDIFLMRDGASSQVARSP